MRRAVFLAALLLSLPASADMYQDGSNAAAQVKFPGSLSVAGGNLASPTPSSMAVEGQWSDPYAVKAARFHYGHPGTPWRVDATYGGNVIEIDQHADSGLGAGAASGMSSGLWSKSRLSAGTTGLAAGVIGEGWNDGTWTPGNNNSGAIGVWGNAASSRGGLVYGLVGDCTLSGVNGGQMACLEIDTRASASAITKYGVAINSSTGDTGAVTGTLTVAGSGAVVKSSAAILIQGLDTGEQWQHALLTIRNLPQPPVNPTGSLWRAGGFPVVSGLNWPDMVFTGPAIHTTGAIRLDNTTSMNVVVLRHTGAEDALEHSIVHQAWSDLVTSKISFIENSLSNFQSGLSFSTSAGAGAVERARFALGTGNFLIGTTTDAAAGKVLQVQGNASVSGGVTVAGLPASAGGGGLAVCVDTAGVLYKKAACP